jgi:hypothetical protein
VNCSFYSSARDTPPTMATSDLPPQILSVGTYTFTISEAGESDIPEFCDVFDSAFTGNLLFNTMSGTGDRAALREENIGFWKKQGVISGRRHFKVVDEGTGCVFFYSAHSLFFHIPLFCCPPFGSFNFINRFALLR